MILTTPQLKSLLLGGRLEDALESAISGSSIDIHLGDTMMIEQVAPDHVADYAMRTELLMLEMDIPKSGHIMRPGDFLLSHSREYLRVPPDCSALLRTKSSMGRIGFEHLDAGWIDPGFEGCLTLEFSNVLKYQSFRIRPGDPVGQLVFFSHEAVPPEMVYSTRGRYGFSRSVEQTRSQPR